jgi:hypothetical protein
MFENWKVDFQFSRKGEFKASSAPEISRSFPGALQDAGIDHTWVVAPVNKMHPLTSKIMVGTIQDFLRFVESL